VSLDADQPYHGSYLMPAFEHATVADAMHPGILSVSPDASLTEVARMMASRHVHCAAVMGVSHEHGGETLVWGLISDLDLVRAGLAADAEQTASTLAKQPIISVEPSTPIREAAERMLSQGEAHVVVIAPGTQRPMGILSTLDIAGILAWGEA
jgi:CBS domain-containing protein